jgi:hypothetical protein
MTATIAIHDLDVSKDLDKAAMSNILGGFRHGYGSYDHFDRGSWKMIYRDSFRTRLAKGGRLYHAIQYQYTWKRTQYWYRGRVRYLGRVT